MVDFGKTAQDYAEHRAGFPEALFERLAPFGVGLPDQHVLDLGTGTGTLARSFARRGCRVTGLDLAAPLLQRARQLDRQTSAAVGYVQAAAERPGLAAGSFNGVSAGQCWHWFDRSLVARQVRRLLLPQGWLLLAHFDWLPLPGNVVEATERLIEQHNPAWDMGGGTGLYPLWLNDVAIAGFQDIETFSFDTVVTYPHRAWRGRIRASAGVAASLEPEQVVRFDADLERLLERWFPGDPLQVPHRVFALVCRAP